MKTKPTVILLKGNGPISINNELMELITITTSHGFIGFPLKQLRAQKVIALTNYDRFLTIEKEIFAKPCCFADWHGVDRLCAITQTMKSAW